jgi:dTDP-4-dehydrorhamnose 3,5-epimerase
VAAAIATRLPGVVLLEPEVHGDERGFFAETLRESELAALGVRERFVQDNQSRSGQGVVRGMHFQLHPPAAKLVRCARGAIVDVVVDIRRGSPAFGEWEAHELDDVRLRTLYVPSGFAHGFCVVSEVADVVYRQTAYWEPGADRGFSPEDPDVGIAWPVPPDARILSARDRAAPRLREIADALPS